MRQAALDVLAVLGQISSPRTVINVVSQVADSRVDGLPLLAAVKARLARKQLPLVSADGDVVYALRIPSATNTGGTIMFGSDVEWICSGSGSVSPTSIKNRSFKLQSSGLHGQQELLGRVGFEDRRLVHRINLYGEINLLILNAIGVLIFYSITKKLTNLKLFSFTQNHALK